MDSQLRKRHVEFLNSGQLTTEVSLVATLFILILSLAAHLFDFIGVWALADAGSVVFTAEAVVLGVAVGAARALQGVPSASVECLPAQAARTPTPAAPAERPKPLAPPLVGLGGNRWLCTRCCKTFQDGPRAQAQGVCAALPRAIHH